MCSWLDLIGHFEITRSIPKKRIFPIPHQECCLERRSGKMWAFFILKKWIFKAKTGRYAKKRGRALILSVAFREMLLLCLPGGNATQHTCAFFMLRNSLAPSCLLLSAWDLGGFLLFIFTSRKNPTVFRLANSLATVFSPADTCGGKRS